MNNSLIRSHSFHSPIRIHSRNHLLILHSLPIVHSQMVQFENVALQGTYHGSYQLVWSNHKPRQNSHNNPCIHHTPSYEEFQLQCRYTGIVQVGHSFQMVVVHNSQKVVVHNSQKVVVHNFHTAS